MIPEIFLRKVEKESRLWLTEGEIASLCVSTLCLKKFPKTDCNFVKS